VARRSGPAKAGPYDDLPIRGARLEPIRYVERVLTSPSGATVKVQVPVYPPFRLEPKPAKPAKPAEGEGRRRKAPRVGARARRGGEGPEGEGALGDTG
jgi:hypothetical protein